MASPSLQAFLDSHPIPKITFGIEYEFDFVVLKSLHKAFEDSDGPKKYQSSEHSDAMDVDHEESPDIGYQSGDSGNVVFLSEGSPSADSRKAASSGNSSAMDVDHEDSPDIGYQSGGTNNEEGSPSANSNSPSKNEDTAMSTGPPNQPFGAGNLQEDMAGATGYASPSEGGTSQSDDDHYPPGYSDDLSDPYFGLSSEEKWKAMRADAPDSTDSNPVTSEPTISTRGSRIHASENSLHRYICAILNHELPHSPATPSLLAPSLLAPVEWWEEAKGAGSEVWHVTDDTTVFAGRRDFALFRDIEGARAAVGRSERGQLRRGDRLEREEKKMWRVCGAELVSAVMRFEDEWVEK